MDAYQQMSDTKTALQAQFRATWKAAGRRGAAAQATGTGKTKPAIDEMMEIYRRNDFWESSSPRFFIAVPTEQLRDIGWPNEVRDWYGEEGMRMWEYCVTCVCYSSMHLYKSGDFDLVILDECHHLTQRSAAFFNARVDIMALSATYPDRNREPEKYELLMQIAPPIFTYHLDQGVDDGIVAPYELHVIRIPLDKVHKNIEAGPAGKRYMTTEADRYNVWSRAIDKMYAEKNHKGADFMVMKRMHFLINLPSKLAVAKQLLNILIDTPTVVDGEEMDTVRTLVFCGSIAQANELGGERVYHSKKKPKKGTVGALERFRRQEISTLFCVKALDEGENIPGLDQGIILQMDSSDRTLTQRLGRIVRWREGHRARVWILVTTGSQDQVWFNKAIKDFDPAKITYHDHTEFLGG